MKIRKLLQYKNDTKYYTILYGKNTMTKLNTKNYEIRYGNCTEKLDQ